MRIVIYQDYLRVGGTESQSIYLCRRFQERGHEAILLTNRPGGALARMVEEYNLTHRVLQKRDRGWNWRCPGLIAALKEIHPDVIILMGRNANCQGWRIRRAFPETGMVATFRTGRRATWMYRRTLEEAPLVLCNSEYAYSRLRSMGIRNKAIEVHPNACLGAEKIAAIRDAERSDIELPFTLHKDHHHLLYVAAFVKGKNHVGLVRMMKRIIEAKPEVTLLLVGDGPLRGRIETLVRKKGLDGCIRFTGYRSDVEHFYAAADIAVSPSLEESMPNFLVEAQYAGLPVVAYDEAGVKECFLPGESGILIRRNDEKAFVSAVVKLIDNVPLLSEMEKKARAHAEPRFDPDLRFQALFQSVLRLAKKNPSV